MIISKDLFIFGEQIFATIIPESASALGTQAQQPQPAIINNTTAATPPPPLPLPTAAAAALTTTTTATTAATTTAINTTASSVIISQAGAAEQVVDLSKATTGAGAGAGAGTDAVTYSKQQKQQQQQQQQQQETVAVTGSSSFASTVAAVVGKKIKVQKIPKEGEELKIQKRKQQQQQQREQQKCETNTTAHSAYCKNPMNLLEESAVETVFEEAEQEPLVKRNVTKLIAPTTTATTTTATTTSKTGTLTPTTGGPTNYTEQRSAATSTSTPSTTSTTIDCRLLLESERPGQQQAVVGQALTVNVNVANSTATSTISASSSSSSSSSSTSQTTIPSSENLCTNMDKPILMVGKSVAEDHHHHHHHHEHEHDHATTVTFPFITEQQQQQQQPTLQLTFQGINVLHNERKILTDVSGLVSPGEVLAIMGPSGSGKTTLLDCLSGQRRIDSGGIFLNREPLSKKWRRRIGYVLQEEIFFTQLTLRETVMYTALLRLPETIPKSEKIRLVDRILEMLELSFCQQTKIGDYLNRGLSGGEKKRANIACELLTNPLLMLLDEPTSGLDSHSAISLMKVLKRYAFQEQKTIVITVHQPSSQMFHMFDKLLLLHNGRTAYFGDVNNIYKHFEGIGVTIKPHYNPADFVLEQLKSYPDIREKLFNAAKESHGNIFNRNCNSVQANNHHNSKHHNHLQNGHLNSDYANGKQQQQQQQQQLEQHEVNSVMDKAQTQSNILINDMINNYYKEIQHNHLHNHNHNHNHNHRNHHSHHKHLKHADTMLSGVGGGGHCDEEAAQHLVWCAADSQSNFSSSGSSDCQSYRDECIGAKASNADWLDYPTRFHTQFRVLSSRNFKEAKPRMLSKLNWFQTIGLALMAGAIWFQIPRTEAFLHDLQGWMFFSQTYWMLFALFGALNSFPSEREVISKERRAGAYRLSAYYLAKMFGELPLVITLPTVYLMISYPMLGCSSCKLFFLMLIFLLLNTMVAQSVGFFIGACCNDMNVSITLSALYTLATQLFGGYLSSRIPEGLSWIRYTSMIHYAYQNMQILEFREGPPIKCGVPSSYEICKNNATTFIPYEEILQAQNSNPLWLNTLVLMMFFLVFRGLGYSVLRYVRCPKT